LDGKRVDVESVVLILTGDVNLEVRDIWTGRLYTIQTNIPTDGRA
jgi:hypothetical protein